MLPHYGQTYFISVDINNNGEDCDLGNGTVCSEGLVCLDKVCGELTCNKHVECVVLKRMLLKLYLGVGKLSS